MRLFSVLKILKSMVRSDLGQLKRRYQLEVAFSDLKIEHPTAIKFDDISIVEIGRGVTIGIYCEIIAMKRFPGTSLLGRLVIGDRCVIGSFTNIRACGGEIRLGRNTILGQHVSLLAANHGRAKGSVYRDAPWDQNRVGITIGENVWIGASSVVLPCVTIGNDSIIGAASVVTKNVPTGEIWLGSPACKLKPI